MVDIVVPPIVVAMNTRLWLKRTLLGSHEATNITKYMTTHRREEHGAEPQVHRARVVTVVLVLFLHGGVVVLWLPGQSFACSWTYQSPADMVGPDGVGLEGSGRSVAAGFSTIEAARRHRIRPVSRTMKFRRRSSTAWLAEPRVTGAEARVEQIFTGHQVVLDGRPEGWVCDFDGRS